jgi:hypothetical protein
VVETDDFVGKGWLSRRPVEGNLTQFSLFLNVPLTQFDQTLDTGDLSATSLPATTTPTTFTLSAAVRKMS